MVRNNLVIDTSIGFSGYGILCGTNATVAHNTIDLRNRTAPYFAGAAYGISASVARYNVVWGGNTSVSASVARDHNLAWGWGAAAYAGAGDAGVPPTDTTGDPQFLGPEDWRVATTSPAVDAGFGSTVTVDLDGLMRDAVPDLGAYEFDPTHVTPPLVWPVREVAGMPTQPSSVMMALRGGPDGGPVLAYLDNDLNTAVFRARNADGTWRGETVQTSLGLTAGYTGNTARHVVAVGIEPGTGVPVMVYPQLRSAQWELHYARRVGDACGTGCSSKLWTGCSLIRAFPNGSNLSFQLAFHPVTGRPVLAVWFRSPGSCGATAARDYLYYLEQQAAGTWSIVQVAASTCGVGYIPSAFGFAMTPAGDAEFVFTRTSGLDAISATGELVYTTNAGTGGGGSNDAGTGGGGGSNDAGTGSGGGSDDAGTGGGGGAISTPGCQCGTSVVDPSWFAVALGLLAARARRRSA